jgi:hypothetical protein
LLIEFSEKRGIAMRGLSDAAVCRLYSSPEYAAVAKAVRYEVLTYDDVKPYFEELERRFGQTNIQAAVIDVCQVNWHESPVTVHLKPEIRKRCYGLLGPAPEQEDEFYRHPDGTPKERPPRSEPDAIVFNREHRPPQVETAEPQQAEKPKRSRRPRRTTGYQAVAAAVADGQAAYAKDHATQAENEPADTRPLEERIRDMEGAELMKNYFKAKAILAANDPTAHHFNLAKESYPLLEAECKRRGYSLPRPYAGEEDAIARALARAPMSEKDAADAHAYVVEKLRAELKQLKASLRSFPKGSPNRNFLLDEIRRVREKLALELDGDGETGVPRSVRDLKKRYRLLMRSYLALPGESPAKAEIKVELQKLRTDIRRAGGGVIF